MNRVILVGRLTKDLELRKTPNGNSVINFFVAVNRPFPNKQTGEREADFVNCVAWGKTAENTATFVGKGSMVGIEGRIQTRSYDNQQGQKVYVTEVLAESIQFLEPKSTNQANLQQNVQEMPAQQQNNDFFADFSQGNNNLQPDILSNLDIDDSELPF